MSDFRDERIKVFSHSDRVEALLAPFREVIGKDFDAYRGHVYRVITYAMHFLEGDEASRPIIETAFVYHDIGLWTENELAYLGPSEELALCHNREQSWGFDPELLRRIIHWHHKVTPYRGRYAKLVEAARKADWIDASGGLRRMGLTKAQVQLVEHAIPNFGFNDVLQRLASDLGGNRISGNLTVLRRVFKW